MKQEPKIGGLPACLWIRRQVKIDMRGHAIKNAVPGAINACLIGIQGRYAIVKPMGHGGTVRAELRYVLPWWSKNPDLKQQAEAMPA